MEEINMLKAKDVSVIMGCEIDTARKRMAEMPGVINVGTAKRRQLLVPLAGLKDWMMDHRMEAQKMPVFIPGPDGRMARRNRRTGELETKKKGR